MENNLEQHENLEFLLLSICRLHYKRLQQMLEEIGLHRGQPPLLFALSKEDGRTHSDLANMMEVSPATITNMIKRMEKAGFVIRQRDSEDERVSRVYLTADGRIVHAKIGDLLAELETTVFAGLSDAAIDNMRLSMQTMQHNLRHSLAETAVA